MSKNSKKEPKAKCPAVRASERIANIQRLQLGARGGETTAAATASDADSRSNQGVAAAIIVEEDSQRESSQSTTTSPVDASGKRSAGAEKPVDVVSAEAEKEVAQGAIKVAETSSFIIQSSDSTRSRSESSDSTESTSASQGATNKVEKEISKSPFKSLPNLSGFAVTPRRGGRTGVDSGFAQQSLYSPSNNVLYRTDVSTSFISGLLLSTSKDKAEAEHGRSLLRRNSGRPIDWRNEVEDLERSRSESDLNRSRFDRDLSILDLNQTEFPEYNSDPETTNNQDDLSLPASPGGGRSDEEIEDNLQEHLAVEENAIVVEMARPNRKFERPANYGGLPDEDVVDWCNRYEKIGTYNQWTDKDLHDNLFMFLKGPADKWWDSINAKPDVWRNTVDAAGVITVEGAKSLLLKAFQKGNYVQFQEGKLRNRKQGKYESAVEYYYDVIGLCNSVDRAMSDKNKVNFLMGGLNAELTEKMYPKEIATADEFLKAVKLDDEARSLAKEKRGEKAEFTVAAVPTTKDQKFQSKDSKFAPIAPADKTVTRSDEAAKAIEKERNEIRRQQRDLEQRMKNLNMGQPSSKELNYVKSKDFDQQRGRDAEGNIICYHCKKPGHIKLRCEERRNAYFAKKS